MENKQPPVFQSNIQTTNPAIQSLLHEDRLYVEKGVNFSKYVTVFPLDSLELIKNGKIVNFVFRDNTCFVNRC